MCGEVANEELWEDAIVAAKNILKGQGEDAIKVRQFVLLVPK